MGHEAYVHALLLPPPRVCTVLDVAALFALPLFVLSTLSTLSTLSLLSLSLSLSFSTHARSTLYFLLSTFYSLSLLSLLSLALSLSLLSLSRSTLSRALALFGTHVHALASSTRAAMLVRTHALTDQQTCSLSSVLV